MSTEFVCVQTADAIPRLMRAGWSLDVQEDGILAQRQGVKAWLSYRDEGCSLLGRDKVNEMCAVRVE